MGISWDGLTKMITSFQETIPHRATEEIRQATEDLFDLTLSAYTDNLSGGGPSTDSSPLPVGIVSGDLLSHAEMDSKIINQYAFEIRNDSDHAGYIEFGTEKMEARAPLADAIRQLEEATQNRMDDAMKEIINAS